MITLVLGGARSGKSEVAERLAGHDGRGVVYVATAAVPDDDADLRARVDAHRARRPPHWDTVECGADLLGALRDVAPGAVALVDSLGTWIASTPEFAADGAALCDVLVARRGDTVVVSEEVGLGVHPSSDAGRRFRDALGTLNRAVADVADRVLLVVAGRVLPLERA